MTISSSKIRPQVMGIVNMTPDSFSDGGQNTTPSQAVKHALRMIDQGANIIDIGGESTRPGAQEISVKEELSRVIPVIKKLVTALTKRSDTKTRISIDTRKAAVAEAAIKAGAHIWNDVSALTFDDGSLDMAVKLDCPVILMHAQGSPDTMQDDPSYDRVVAEVKLWLTTRIAVAVAAGVKQENITIDPGIGFGKTLEHNLALLKQISAFNDLGTDVLIGASRKSYISKIDGSDVDHRLGGSLATALWSMTQGASIIRVHDVQETVQALDVWDRIQG